ncbi:MAG: adenosine kinase [Cyclobacteriaceae bacterium]
MKKVLGMGNALVDIMTMLENDKLLSEFDLPKGSMQLVDALRAEKIKIGIAGLKQEIASGGSAANTINGLAYLGVDTGYIGKIGNDVIGDLFRKGLEEINVQAQLLIGNMPSGTAIALVSPDAERTFATHLGAAIELTPDDLQDDLFEGYHYFHIEGYLVQNHELIRQAVQKAAAKGLTISLDMASYNVVEANLEFLKEIIRDYVDIVFANEEEAKALTGKEPEAALNELAEMCDIAVVKIGKGGSFIKSSGKTHKVGIIEVNSIDSTGAGDLYAAGFLYGMVHDMSLDRCGKIGALLAGNVLEVLGARMDQSRWIKIKETLKSI